MSPFSISEYKTRGTFDETESQKMHKIKRKYLFTQV